MNFQTESLRDSTLTNCHANGDPWVLEVLASQSHGTDTR
jgi:hypothetical protein